MNRESFLSWYSEKFRSPRALRPGTGDPQYSLWGDRVLKSRGRPWWYPYMESGRGNGPFVELADGSVKLDFITGIGVHFFGHAHPELKWAAIEGLIQEPGAIQGNLQFSPNYVQLTEDLLAAAQSCQPTRLSYGWISPTGAMANENGLKIVRQKRSPAYKVLTFRNCFLGRTQTMAELTDNASYKEGLPDFKQVTYLPFYDAKDPKSKTVFSELDRVLQSAKDYAVFVVELIQGEGGFRTAPREFFEEIFKRVSAHGIPIWIDEVQTFGRTGEYFAFQKFGLEKYVDMVTVGKMLHACATLYTKELNPKAGLVSGTFAASTSSLAIGRWVLRTLKEGGYLGANGRVTTMEEWVKEGLDDVAQRTKHMSNITAVGGMVAFQVFDGNADRTKQFLSLLFKNGLIAFSCGREPTRVRFLLPAGVLTPEDFQVGLEVIEKTLNEAACTS